ncbi:MAG: Rieske 2Fe-2S domain-containing protein [Chloroflexi bacterium]|nr:Rieske 2Fe-2S domain-containing protein [Chloroflexota bacterium]
MDKPSVEFIFACRLDELVVDGMRVVHGGPTPLLLVHDRGRVFALDNRCPHMGFPLHQGSVEDGILTCHWHHAKFDLAGGCTFDPFADDVAPYRVEIREGTVWLDPRPQQEVSQEHWLSKLSEGLEQNIGLVLAKSVVALDELGVTAGLLRKAALFGVRNRAGGWSSGLSILASLANVLQSVDREDRPLALYHGMVHVARSTAGQPPAFDLEPLETSEARPERYTEWFRRFIEVRASDAAERTLRTAIRAGLPPETIAGMIFAASTDHLFMDVGHTLDFANKAFELLDHIGWEHAEEVLSSLVPGMVKAQRMEETSSWRHPVDLPGLLGEVYEELDSLIDEGGQGLTTWTGHEDLAELVLDGEPAQVLGEIKDLVRRGVPLIELSASVAYAAARRAVHFHVANSFSDWNTVHHTFTYANAVDQALRRVPSKLLARGIFDGAMSVYLERFLNVPKQPVPEPSGRDVRREDVLAAIDSYGGVDETAQLVADMIAMGRQEEVIQTLGHALLREDAGFHQFQIYEAGVRQYRQFALRPAGGQILIGVARFLAAHAPTVRSSGQTYNIAAKLHRGEALYGEE